MHNIASCLNNIYSIIYTVSVTGIINLQSKQRDKITVLNVWGSIKYVNVEKIQGYGTVGAVWIQVVGHCLCHLSQCTSPFHYKYYSLMRVYLNKRNWSKQAPCWKYITVCRLVPVLPSHFLSLIWTPTVYRDGFLHIQIKHHHRFQKAFLYW